MSQVPRHGVGKFMNKPAWEFLLRVAEVEVQRVLRGMPGPLREKAREVPVIYQLRPTPTQRADGIEADLMGLFIGVAFPEGDAGGVDLPPQIFLFLANIWDEGEGDEAVYREEVRTTYLHELGHYLGLDEDGLEARDLE